MSFPLETVPTQLRCPKCGHQLETELSLARAFEWLVARELDGTVAGFQNKGYDVHQSDVYPKFTFQVKYSQPSEGRLNRRRDKQGNSYARPMETWTWTSLSPYTADWYVLFGLRGSIVYPFLLSNVQWKKESSIIKKPCLGYIVICRTHQFSHQGVNQYSTGSACRRQNKLWQYYLTSWPSDLHDRLNGKSLPTQLELPIKSSSPNSTPPF